MKSFYSTLVVSFFLCACVGGHYLCHNDLARSGFRYAFWILMAALIFRAMPHITLVSGYMLPFFVLILFFQRQIVSGLTAGAVKG